MAFTDSNVFVTTTQILKFIRTKYGRQYVCKVNAARKSKVDDNTARMQSIKQLGV